MADETVVGSKAEVAWKWFIGFVPSIGWDAAFQGPLDLRDRLGKDHPDHFTARALSRLEFTKDNQMILRPWAPAYFQAVNQWSEFTLPKAMFLWIGDVTPAAEKDWDEAWDAVNNPKPVEKPSIIQPASEVDSKLAVAMAKGREKAVKQMKAGIGLHQV
jgi:hypothetical protein